MSRRTELQTLLEEILGSKNVYFQPPDTFSMKYPAIVYSLNRIDKKSANDSSYIQKRSYTVTLIDKNPDSEFIDKISSLPLCQFDRPYKSDNLNHYVFTLYF